MQNSERLRRAERITQGEDFRQLKKSLRKKGCLISLYWRENQLNYSRLGLIVRRKCLPSACSRNRVKRIFREVYRKNKFSLRKGLDFYFCLEKPDKNVTYNEIEKDFLQICKKNGLSAFVS
jgi:ribonuclease P protein component